LFDLAVELGVVSNVYLRVGVHLYLPLVFEVEVHGARLAFGLCLVLLHPGLEPNVELPSSSLEFQGSQVLLIRSLLVVEGEEQTLLIQLLEVVLASEHLVRREVAALLNFYLLISLRCYWWLEHWESTPLSETILHEVLVLHRRHVDKRSRQELHASFKLVELFRASRDRVMGLGCLAELRLFCCWEKWLGSFTEGCFLEWVRSVKHILACLRFYKRREAGFGFCLLLNSSLGLFGFGGLRLFGGQCRGLLFGKWSLLRFFSFR